MLVSALYISLTRVRRERLWAVDLAAGTELRTCISFLSKHYRATAGVRVRRWSSAVRFSRARVLSSVFLSIFPELLPGRLGGFLEFCCVRGITGFRPDTA